MKRKAKWCPGPELNRYVSFETRDFKSRASASFATRALTDNYSIVQNLVDAKPVRCLSLSTVLSVLGYWLTQEALALGQMLNRRQLARGARRAQRQAISIVL